MLSGSDCQACEEADTYENIMDHYCRADFGKYLTVENTKQQLDDIRIQTVARTKLRRMRHNSNKVSGKKSKMLKMSPALRDEWRRNKRPNLVMELGEDCCTEHLNTVTLSRQTPNGDGSNNDDRFLVMGIQRNGQLVPTLVLPWTKKSKVRHEPTSMTINIANRLFV